MTTDKKPTAADNSASNQAGKREWIEPQIEVADAREAEAFIGPPGGVDGGIYS